MGKHTLLYCRGCLTCQRRNGGIKHNAGLLQYFVASKKNEMISVDVLSGVPRSKHGNKYILVVSDYFTKYCIAIPMINKTSECLIRALYTYSLQKFGPGIITSYCVVTTQ